MSDSNHCRKIHAWKRGFQSSAGFPPTLGMVALAQVLVKEAHESVAFEMGVQVGMEIPLDEAFEIAGREDLDS